MLISDSEYSIDAAIFGKIINEREKQINKLGKDDDSFHDNHYIALSIFLEEAGEVAQALNDKDFANMKEEIIQCLAVGFKWLSHFDKMEANAQKQSL